MERLSLRLYVLLITAASWLRAFAQEEDDDDDLGIMRRQDPDDMMSLEDYMDYQPFHIRFSDVMTILFILILCYVFGKIWKGCSYLILLLAVLFYFFIR